MDSTHHTKPLDALHSAVRRHGEAQSALWDDIDNAVAEAAAELNTERQASDTATETVQGEHGQPET